MELTGRNKSLVKVKKKTKPNIGKQKRGRETKKVKKKV